MKFGLLGDLTIEDNGYRSTPTAPKQRQLFALLLFNANHAISVDSCLEELWDCAPPESARYTLQSYVLRIRHTFSRFPSIGSLSAAHQRLATRPGGYCLTVLPGELDVHVFEELSRSAWRAVEQGDDKRAVALMRDGLGIWRGPALADVSPGPLLRTQLAGLQESRISLLEQRNEAELRLGHHRELLSELTRLAASHPLNENLHAQLMLALYRSGRHAEALRVYHTIANLLRDDLGVDPSPRLRRLYDAMLVQHENLEVATATSTLDDRGPLSVGRTSMGRTSVARTLVSRASMSRG